MKGLAPIGISTYSRLSHLKKTVDSLKKNTLASKSNLYIFSDAPKDGDEDIVSQVRNYCYSIRGFNKISVIERDKNNRVRNNRDGMKLLLDRYNKMIFLEDDNITSPLFLEYMNDALDFYEKEKKIFSICGYNVNTSYPGEYNNDYYLSKYFSAWGFASWKDRNLLQVLENNNNFLEMKSNKELYKKVKKIHPKLIHGLESIQNGTLDAGDYKIVFHLIKENQFCIKPIKSFVDNTGHDGSGEHCNVSEIYANSIMCEKKIIFTDDVQYSQKIDLVGYHYKYYYLLKRYFHKRVFNKIKMIVYLLLSQKSIARDTKK